MKVLITGTAGFIGFHLANALLHRGYEVVGIDNLNDYYDVHLKYDRLAEAGIARYQIKWNKELKSTKFSQYTFIKANLQDKQAVMATCEKHRFDIVVNLAAQAGVRYSITNPDVYIQSNLVGFFNVLEACRFTGVRHLVYASSSSVYGLNEQIPFCTSHDASHPISLYAATKKSNELMAHTYSYLFQIPTTGLRFFTVYGPWGRPDMACYLFADAITKGDPIQVFNHGKMKRDFTYIDDIIQGIINVINYPALPCKSWDAQHPDPSRSVAPYRVFNIGNNQPVELSDFIRELEKQMGKKAILEMREMQAGDVLSTWADINDLAEELHYRPRTPIQFGLKQFASWYKNYTAFKEPAPDTVEVKQPLYG